MRVPHFSRSVREVGIDLAKSLPVVMKCPFASPSGDPTRRGGGLLLSALHGSASRAGLCKAGEAMSQGS